MKILLLAIMLTSCTTTVTSPITQISYTGYISEDGVGLTLKPPFWGYAVNGWKWLTGGDEDE